jgi:hypothetical protein
MTAAALLSLLEALEPAIKETVVELVSALHKKDAASARAALEAALRLQFEARQDV